MNYERLVILLLIATLLVALFRPVNLEISEKNIFKNSPQTEVSNKQAVLDVIHNRKSVRKYTKQSVSKEDINILIKAGMAAPTAGNTQPWAFVVVDNREKLDAMAKFMPYGKMLYDAPVAIVVCGMKSKFFKGVPEYWVQDTSAATENILLAAEAIGLGAVWLGVYPMQDRVNQLSQILNLGSEVIPLNIISIGHPTGVEKPKNKFKEDRIRYNSWIK